MAVSSPLFDVSEKIAVVTGSSRGIGRAIAFRLAEAGAKVVVSSRKLGACETVVAEIEAAVGPGRAMACAARISDKASLLAMADAAVERFGKVDILVCNAASNPYYGPMTGIGDDQFRKILDNNVIANNWLISRLAPQMRARRDGVIILISSAGGLRGSSMIGAYNISKAADMQMARNLAVEFGADNIRVNCIAPGLIRTDFSRALWEDEKILAESLRTTPLGRIGQVDEVAGAAVFLASSAGSFITGQTLIIDGGITIAWQ